MRNQANNCTTPTIASVRSLASAECVWCRKLGMESGSIMTTDLFRHAKLHFRQLSRMADDKVSLDEVFQNCFPTYSATTPAENASPGMASGDQPFRTTSDDQSTSGDTSSLDDNSSNRHKCDQLALEIYQNAFSFDGSGLWCELCHDLVPIKSAENIIGHVTDIHVAGESQYKGSYPLEQKTNTIVHGSQASFEIINETSIRYCFENSHYWSEVKKTLHGCFLDETLVANEVVAEPPRPTPSPLKRRAFLKQEPDDEVVILDEPPFAQTSSAGHSGASNAGGEKQGNCGSTEKALEGNSCKTQREHNREAGWPVRSMPAKIVPLTTPPPVEYCATTSLSASPAHVITQNAASTVAVPSEIHRDQSVHPAHNYEPAIRREGQSMGSGKWDKPARSTPAKIVRPSASLSEEYCATTSHSASPAHVITQNAASTVAVPPEIHRDQSVHRAHNSEPTIRQEGQSMGSGKWDKPARSTPAKIVRPSASFSEEYCAITSQSVSSPHMITENAACTVASATAIHRNQNVRQAHNSEPAIRRENQAMARGETGARKRMASTSADADYATAPETRAKVQTGQQRRNFEKPVTDVQKKPQRPIDKLFFISGTQYRCLLCGKILQQPFAASSHAQEKHNILPTPPVKKATTSHAARANRWNDHGDSEASCSWSQKRTMQTTEALWLNTANNGNRYFEKRMKTAGSLSGKRRTY